MPEPSTDCEAALATYEADPDRLRAALGGLSEPDLDLARAPGEWSIRQIVHHLAEGEPIWARCIISAVGNPGCTITLGGYTNNDDWAKALDYAGRPIDRALDLFATSRTYTAQLLRHMPGAWEQGITLTAPGAPPEGVKMTVAGIVGMLNEHTQEHIAAIQATRQAHSGQGR